MSKNDFASKKSSKAKPAGRRRSDRDDSVDRNPQRPGTGTGKRNTSRSSFGKQAEGAEPFGRRSRKDGEGGRSGVGKSTDWSTGGYRVTKKGTGKGAGRAGYNKGISQGAGGPRRDDDQDFRGQRRDGPQEFRGQRRDGPQDFREQRRDGSQDFRGQRRDGPQDFRDSRRDADKNYRGPRKDDGQGYKGPRKETRAGAFRDQKKGFVKKTPRSPINKRDEFRNKKEEIEITRTSNEAEIYDNAEREDRVEGRNSVFEAMRSGRPLNKLFVEKDSEDVLIRRIVAIAREKNIPIQYLERNKLDSISQTRTHQGVILEVAAKEYVEIEDIIKIAEKKGEKPFVLVLDGITDTNNLGSIIRSAECAGVHGIILPKRRSATLNTTVAKVAAGALEYVQVARVANLVQTLRTLKNEGLWIIGADMDGETNFQDTDLTGSTALVIGSEGEGLARLVKEECDLTVKIPMKGKISSLNAGVAAGLIMFEISRQRDKL